MKRRSLLSILMFAPMAVLAKKPKKKRSDFASAPEGGSSDWEYGNFQYSATIAGDDLELPNCQARIVGVEFPYGLTVTKGSETLAEFQAALMRIVDALSDTN